MSRNTRLQAKRVFQMHRTNPAHQYQLGFVCFLRLIISSRVRQRENLTLPGNGRVVRTVYHPFALSNPAEFRAPLKNRFPVPAAGSSHTAP
jgi:hypothetical protein